jgi:hypothetical protein
MPSRHSEPFYDRVTIYRVFIILGRTPLNETTQPSPDTDDDWDAKATEALEAVRLMRAGKEKSEALKRAARQPTYTNHFRRRSAAGRESTLNGV